MTDDELDAAVAASLGRILSAGTPYTSLPLVNPETGLLPDPTVDAIREPLETAVALKLDADTVGAADGVAQLDEESLVPLEQIPVQAIADSDELSTTIDGVVGASTAANLRAVAAKLDRGVQDASVLIVSDSTGNQQNEWPYLVAEYLADRYPAYTVLARFWDETGEVAYSSAVTVQTGTGAQTLTMWIAARAGSVPAYFLGSRFNVAIRDTYPDAVIINHGHNMGDPTGTQAIAGAVRNQFLAITEEIALTHPSAGIVLMSQNPTALAGRETWQAIKGQYAEQVAGLRGYGFIDVEQAFQDYGDWLADLTNGDGIHPSPAGSILWASLVTRAFASARSASVARIEESPINAVSRNYLLNSDFSDFAGSIPESWTASLATVAKDTTNYETGSWGAKLTPDVTSGTSQIEQSLGAVLARELRGQTVTAAVRVIRPAATTQTIRVQLVDSTGSGNQRIVDVSPYSTDRFTWVFVTKVIDAAATNVTLRLQARASGTAVGEVTFDRAIMVKGIMPKAGLLPEAASSGGGEAGVGDFDHLSTLGSPGAVIAAMGAGVGSSAAGTAMLLPIKPARDVTAAILGWMVHTTGGNYDIGIFSSTGTKLWSKGSTAVPAAGVITETVSPPVALTAGTLYYIGLVFDGTTALARGIAGISGELMRNLDGTASARAALSAHPFGASVSVGSSAQGRIPVIVVREA